MIISFISIFPTNVVKISLQQRAAEAGNAFGNFLPLIPLPPFVAVELHTGRCLAEEPVLYSTGAIFVIYHRKYLKIVLKTPHIHIGGTHNAHLPVYAHHFGVVESLLEEIYLHSGLQQFTHIRHCAVMGQEGV